MAVAVGVLVQTDGGEEWAFSGRRDWGIEAYQSESNSTTMSAVYRLIPSPPAAIYKKAFGIKTSSMFKCGCSL